MAIRRAKQKQQVMNLLHQVAPPGETFVAAVHCESGPSPWLGMVFDQVPLMGTIVALTRKYYFLVVTNTSLVVFTANRFTNRPGTVLHAYPLDAVPVTAIKRARTWSSVYLTFPSASRPRRLNVSRYWRGELDQLIAALPEAQVRTLIGDR